MHFYPSFYDILRSKVDFNVGKRLKWLRLILNLTLQDIADGININPGTYWNRENNISGHIKANEVYRLSQYFQKLWDEKYKDQSYPIYGTQKVSCINAEWILYGKSVSLNHADNFLKVVEDDFRARERELLDRIHELEGLLGQGKAQK